MDAAVIVLSAHGVVGITRKVQRKDMLPSLLSSGTECDR